ncbi:hypothetical protein SS1G_12696 [Sclerotinia sclerotiorum 1980 UF-70]|uniref:Wax synthase domain-containing protein n=2 Tax=Sclerotinia sclerotiorum (strain ATCC 18683 / 1980 / Ss-1) TaxID=665079 RepID=A7F521_SCLS1|nr:hypothetical protein SS1G_12696 [Sclerotinia sclerotiorum 1980 UF-70]APA06584.1 hypothetical protein sscle_02g013540 [Sclerotinia sclerotiorum 1980 UF-70]EDN97842.1 hypothetical protein SS1G_12696 [Sclerotinia sclerotiorum 1980 UF-70]
MPSLFTAKQAGAPSPQDVIATHRRTFENRVAEGTLRPMVLPYHLYGYILLGIYLSVRHTNRPILYKARWIVLAIMTWFQLKTLWHTSSKNMAISFVAGLMSSYGIATSLTWLVFMRPQFDAKRIERRKIQKYKSATHDNEGKATAYAESTESGLRPRVRINGEGGRSTVGSKASSGRDVGTTHGQSNADGMTEFEYYWQSYPDNIRERLDWISDLVINFRGPGWNWTISTLPKPPPFIYAKLGEPADEASKNNKSSTGIKRFTTRLEILRTQVPRFIIGYFLLDAVKTTMMNDSYFWLGPNDYAMSAHAAAMSPLIRCVYRELLSIAGVLISLDMAFLLAPITGCLLLGPSSFMGLRGEPWYYATTWGSFSVIANKGLAGLWGGAWHQIFRLIFSAPTNHLIANRYLNPKSSITKLIASIFAFGISGVLHASGSISQIPSTKPWNPPIFFMLQALGIYLQTGLCTLFGKYIKKIPKPIRQTTNVVYALSWGLLTGWWLADDFARGGIWLYEPIPISIFRGLGFAGKDHGWWCWEHIGVGWYTGEHWWQSGVTI